MGYLLLCLLVSSYTPLLERVALEEAEHITQDLEHALEKETDRTPLSARSGAFI